MPDDNGPGNWVQEDSSHQQASPGKATASAYGKPSSHTICPLEHL